MDTDDCLADARASYDTVAESYADYVRGTLDAAPCCCWIRMANAPARCFSLDGSETG
jgi:hypothetical protein